MSQYFKLTGLYVPVFYVDCALCPSTVNCLRFMSRHFKLSALYVPSLQIVCVLRPVISNCLRFTSRYSKFVLNVLPKVWYCCYVGKKFASAWQLWKLLTNSNTYFIQFCYSAMMRCEGGYREATFVLGMWRVVDWGRGIVGGRWLPCRQEESNSVLVQWSSGYRKYGDKNVCIVLIKCTRGNNVRN